MRKVFKKGLAVATSITLVATMAVGVGIVNSSVVKAEDTATPVTLANWNFVQGGQFSETELWNTAYINSVTMNDTNEVINGWRTGTASINQEITASQVSTGFAMDIDSNSQDKDWANDRINPWAIRAEMKDVSIKKGHIYTVSFKAKASKKKYCYVAFACDVEGTAPYGEDLVAGNNQLITLTTTEQTFTYTFTNWVSATKLTTTLMLGAFNSQYDYAGNDVSDIITEVESLWGGQVYVSDFTITDNGLDSRYEEELPAPSDNPNAGNNNNNNNNNNAAGNNNNAANNNATTVAPTTAAPATVAKPAQVKSVKAKNSAKKTVKVTWKKAARAKSYQVKVGTKKYTTKKVSLTVKKLKVGKTYKVQVRAKNATGYGKWSKAVKVKVNK